MKWTTFWDTLESAIHQNPTLTNIQKLEFALGVDRIGTSSGIDNLL